MNQVNKSTQNDTAGNDTTQERRRVRLHGEAISAAVVVAIAALLVSCGDEATPTEQSIESTAESTVGTDEDSSATSVQEPPTVVSGPYFLDLGTGEQTPLPDGIRDSGVFSYVASPDGTRLAYNTCCSGSDVASIANIDGTEARELTSPEGLAYYAGRWSPDGTKLVYQERAGADIDVGSLVVYDPASGDRTQLTSPGLTDAEWWFLSPRFSPDGRSVIFHLPRTPSSTTEWDVWSVPVTGGEPTLVLQDAYFPLYLPDGKDMAFVLPSESDLAGRNISITSADGQGSPRTLMEAKSSIFLPTVSPDGTRIAYADDGSIYVVAVSTGESSVVADTGSTAEWLDDDTLIVNP